MNLILSLRIKINSMLGYKSDDQNRLTSPSFIVFSLLSFLLILLSYSNHFNNDFQFDDFHTIPNNTAIHEINVEKFFKDGSTFSSLPSNQSYRPLTTLENAIDYKLGNGGTKVFHYHIFISFILVCILYFVLVRQIVRQVFSTLNYNYWALLSATIFGTLCANAETVNYIIQRAEIVSAFFILAGLVFFISGGFWRKSFLYLIFPFIGFFSKEMAFVFSPLLFLYVIIFEQNTDLSNFYKKEEFRKIIKSFIIILPSFILTFLFLFFYVEMLPDTFSTGSISRYNYLITQPLVIGHYVLTFFVPYNLSADTDWVLFDTLFDIKALLGFFILFLIIYIAFKTSKKNETKIISFGLFWFLISLLPTSSIVPFSEVLNDHRCFIPYLGLTISFVFTVRLLILKLGNKLLSPVVYFFALFIGLNAFGVHKRNEVWKDQLSLWKDVTEKSPKNGRGFMNYGLALMAKGELQLAEKNYLKALELTPNYNTLYINLAILKNQLGDVKSAETNFLKAIKLSPNTHTAYYYYGDFLFKQNRIDEAIENLQISLYFSPSFSFSINLLFKVLHTKGDFDSIEKLAKKVLNDNPNDSLANNFLQIAKNKISFQDNLLLEVKKNPTAEKFLNLSLYFFEQRNYQQSINASEQALELKPNYADAYNNIGIANASLGNYDEAILAYNKALEINPSYELAKNNLKNVLIITDKLKSGELKLTADDYLNLSLKYYNEGDFNKCIEAAYKSIEIKPSANAYSNICIAYTQLKEFDKAIEACDKALSLEKNHQLAIGNKNLALTLKNKNNK